MLGTALRACGIGVVHGYDGKRPPTGSGTRTERSSSCTRKGRARVGLESSWQVKKREVHHEGSIFRKEQLQREEMDKVKSLRLPADLLRSIRYLARKERLDESTAIRKLIGLGAEEYAVRLYREGGV